MSEFVAHIRNHVFDASTCLADAVHKQCQPVCARFPLANFVIAKETLANFITSLTPGEILQKRFIRGIFQCGT